MKRVLVTGGSGFIGRHCIPILEEKGYGVICYPGDLLKHVGYLPKVTHLLHLAWETTPGIYWESTSNIDWYEASLHLFQDFRAAGGKRIVVAGTCAEETDTLYGRSKDALRRTLEAYSNMTGISCGWGRIFYPYGPYEKPTRLISSAINSILRGKEFTVNNPIQFLDFLHVQDVASALVSLLDSDVTGTVDIGDGTIHSTQEVVTIISRKINKPDLVLLGDIDATDSFECDPSRLRNEVKWTPKFSLDTGLDDTIAWWRKELGL